MFPPSSANENRGLVANKNRVLFDKRFCDYIYVKMMDKRNLLILFNSLKLLNQRRNLDKNHELFKIVLVNEAFFNQTITNIHKNKFYGNTMQVIKDLLLIYNVIKISDVDKK